MKGKRTLVGLVVLSFVGLTLLSGAMSSAQTTTTTTTTTDPIVTSQIPSHSWIASNGESVGAMGATLTGPQSKVNAYVKRYNDLMQQFQNGPAAPAFGKMKEALAFAQIGPPQSFPPTMDQCFLTVGNPGCCGENVGLKIWPDSPYGPIFEGLGLLGCSMPVGLLQQNDIYHMFDHRVSALVTPDPGPTQVDAALFFAPCNPGYYGNENPYNADGFGWVNPAIPNFWYGGIYWSELSAPTPLNVTPGGWYNCTS